MPATASPSRRSGPDQTTPVKPTAPSAPPAATDSNSPSDAPILFQDYFKSVGPRTYAAQVKRARNDNHFLLLTEGKRDAKTGEVRKTKLLVFSEDFESFFNMVNQVATFVRANPVPASVAQRQKKFWSGKSAPAGEASRE